MKLVLLGLAKHVANGLHEAACILSHETRIAFDRALARRNRELTAQAVADAREAQRADKRFN